MEKDTQLQLANQQLSQLKDTSIFQFVLGVCSLIGYGIGINFLTEKPPNSAGGWLIGAAIVCQGISFLMAMFAKFRTSKLWTKQNQTNN